MSIQPASLLPYGIVRIGGVDLSKDLASAIVLLRVSDSVRLPDQAYLRIADPRLAYIDSDLLAVGKNIEILYGASGSSTPTSVFTGPIESVELDFAASGAFIAVTAYEPAFALHRNRRTQIFQNMTSADIARKLIGAVGLTARLDATGASSDVHPFLLQAQETDWQLLWRLADAIGYEVAGENHTVNFRKADSAPTTTIELCRPGDLASFRPRMSAAQQVDNVQVRGWDPASAEAIVASEDPPPTESDLGVARADIATTANAGEWAIADRTVLGQQEASALAQSIATRQANDWLQADGVARGDPRLRAGCKVKIEGVGERFGGTYTLTSTTHVLRGGRGYETHFSISGRRSNTLLGILDQGAPVPWGTSLVVGVVTQNDDPEGLGRVRVRYPALGENAEGWWARVLAPGAGTARGLSMMPVAGDEVVVAFEQGDTRRAYVLGAVWNGMAKPGEVVKQDGSFSLASDHNVTLTATQQLALTAKGDMSLQGSKAVSVKSEQQLELAGSSVTVKADGSVTVQAGGELTLKGQSITLQAATVKISGQVSFL